MDHAVGVLICYTPMSNNNHSATVAVKFRQVSDDFGGILRVEISCRLVCQDDFGPIE